MEISLENWITFESSKLREPSGMTVNKDKQIFVISSSESVCKVSNSYSKVFVFNEKGKFQNSFQIDGTDADLGTDLTSVHCMAAMVYASNRVLHPSKMEH